MSNDFKIICMMYLYVLFFYVNDTRLHSIFIPFMQYVCLYREAKKEEIFVGSAPLLT